jgi:flagellar motility protein MotE (MotC chaperone)
LRALVDDAAGKDVRHLVAMYEQMKPKQAGQIFNAMDPTFAAGFLGQMNAPSAALILANMDAEKAYSVSLLLAGRNVDRP